MLATIVLLAIAAVALFLAVTAKPIQDTQHHPVPHHSRSAK